ncbi:hypothetical protein N0V88_001119 [Collariella sp. IMI 366227]|nr:hypothetical protein N0V88_001119 [Collariella sp. IMI 366227]
MPREDEGRRIMEMVQECGQRWAQIARNLGTNRSDNQIKNWWNGAKRKETSKRQDVSPIPGQHLSPTPGLAALSERRGVLPPSRLDLPFRPDNLSPPTVTDLSARSYMSDRPPSLVSDHGSAWSISPPAYSPLALPPLLPSPQQQHQQQQDGYYLNPGPKQSGFGPARRSSEVSHHPPRGYIYHSSSPQSCYAKTAPTSPINRASSRWEPYRTSGRRPSTGYLKDEKNSKSSLAFMLN